MAAPNRGRGAQGTQSRPLRPLLVILIALVALTGGMFLSGHKTPRLGIDLAGGTSITLEAKEQPGKKGAINAENMNTAVNIIERRVNGLGVSEAEVQTQGDKHIIVNIPKGTDQAEARQQVGTTAKLYFRPVLAVDYSGANPAPSGSASSSPSPNASSSSSATPKADSSATPKADSSASPSASSTTQGRALTQGLKAQDSSPSASTSPKASATPEASSSAPADATTDPGAAAGGVTTDQQAALAALDCTTPAKRAQAAEKAAAATEKDTIVACDQDGAQKYVLGPAAVLGTDVDKAQASYDTQQGRGWIVNMDFTGKGGKKFASVTGDISAKADPQNRFAIELDGEVVSAPSVSQAISGGQAFIEGSFDQKSAESLANVLSYGALPLTFDEASVDTVSAALGSDQLHAGLIAGAIGLALVVIYLVFYYRGLSLIAIASLMVSAALTYTIMALLGPTIGFALNLPAVCGAIVAIGITADSFIVYFERIRDEIRHGRSLQPAVERAWPRARRTILVSDFVSFLAAAVLFAVTVGKVQGFAFTLGLTTVLDVVVVFLFTKPLMTILARTKFFGSGHPWSGLDPRRLGVQPPIRRGRRSSAPLDLTKEA
ncbi:protein translocase subunit SecD [Streptomyces sp. NPDC051940]|uniref:protein translocase subunit SecD n=1 Tax=Streptomyces sp. NPDC051940 TaxID=3155675 RepID=UPI003436AEA2